MWYLLGEKYDDPERFHVHVQHILSHSRISYYRKCAARAAARIALVNFHAIRLLQTLDSAARSDPHSDMPVSYLVSGVEAAAWLGDAEMVSRLRAMAISATLSDVDEQRVNAAEKYLSMQRDIDQFSERPDFPPESPNSSFPQHYYFLKGRVLENKGRFDLATEFYARALWTIPLDDPRRSIVSQRFQLSARQVAT